MNNSVASEATLDREQSSHQTENQQLEHDWPLYLFFLDAHSKAIWHFLL